MDGFLSIHIWLLLLSWFSWLSINRKLLSKVLASQSSIKPEEMLFLLWLGKVWDFGYGSEGGPCGMTVWRRIPIPFLKWTPKLHNGPKRTQPKLDFFFPLKQNFFLKYIVLISLPSRHLVSTYGITHRCPRSVTFSPRPHSLEAKVRNIFSVILFPLGNSMGILFHPQSQLLEPLQSP